MKLTLEYLQELYESGQKIPAGTPLHKAIVAATSFLTGKVFPRQRLYHLIHNVCDVPKCKMCANPVRWNDTARTADQTYRVYCGHKCQCNDPENKEKKNQTELLRYGKGRPEIVEKIKITNRAHHGVDFAMQVEAVKQKQKQTVRDHHGVDNVMQLQSIKDVRVQTNLDRFGVEAPAQNRAVVEKAFITYIDRHGSVENRYRISKLKTVQTNQKNHGVDSIHQLHISKENLQKLHSKEWLQEQHIKNKLGMRELGAILGVKYTTIKFHLNRFKIPVCHYPKSKSVAEDSLIAFLASFIPSEKLEIGSREIISPSEIDVYIPSFKLAIELDGLYWHSEIRGKGKNYHLNKTQKCQQQGIRLIHIFNSEWNNKQDIVKSRLLSLIGQNTKIPARETTVSVLSSPQAKLFFQETHIQGGGPRGSVNLGLIYQNELVAAMSFIKSRFNKKYEYELLRFSSKLNTNVIGGVGKLFSHFIKNYNPQSIITYSDKRWGVGETYLKLGFQYLHTSPPNYWYFRGTDLALYSRIKFQKHKLQNLLENFDSNLTEWENMKNNGWNRIWDCGNDVWIWNKDSVT